MLPLLLSFSFTACLLTFFQYIVDTSTSSFTIYANHVSISHTYSIRVLLHQNLSNMVCPSTTACVLGAMMHSSLTLIQLCGPSTTIFTSCLRNSQLTHILDMINYPGNTLGIIPLLLSTLLCCDPNTIAHCNHNQFAYHIRNGTTCPLFSYTWFSMPILW